MCISISIFLAQVFVQFKRRHHGRRWAPGPTAFPSRPISPRPSPRPALPCPARRLCCHVPSRPCRPSLHASSHPIPLRPAPPRSRRALFALSRHTPSHLAQALLVPSPPLLARAALPAMPHTPSRLPRPAMILSVPPRVPLVPPRPVPPASSRYAPSLFVRRSSRYIRPVPPVSCPVLPHVAPSSRWGGRRRTRRANARVRRSRFALRPSLFAVERQGPRRARSPRRSAVTRRSAAARGAHARPTDFAGGGRRAATRPLVSLMHPARRVQVGAGPRSAAPRTSRRATQRAADEAADVAATADGSADVAAAAADGSAEGDAAPSRKGQWLAGGGTRVSLRALDESLAGGWK